MKISPEIKARMKPFWKKKNPVPFKDLRYLKIKHWGFDGNDHEGEIVIHRELATEVREIFEELYERKFPIKSLRLIEDFEADDEKSMAANNSSGFCSRYITGSTSRFSLHSHGRAIDINPVQNPYINGDILLPEQGELYRNRTLSQIGMIYEENPCHHAFLSRGWKWGGDWRTLSHANPNKFDYHHFSKP
ncbi:MAG: hypothetical protein ACI9S8_002771, partial [Chlamydiales bacterium]